MITLRDYTIKDVERLVTLANNKNVSQYLVNTFPYPYTKSDAVWWIKTGSKANGIVSKVIKYQNLFVGSVGITPQSGWREHVAEIGYWLGEEYWGNGIATKALTQMTDYAFSVLRYRKLFAEVLSENKASMRVLEKCGYELEGILKQEVCKDGKYFDVFYYGKYYS